MTTHIDVPLKLLLAAFFGGLIGAERESLNRAAGLRTHVLVCVGSALVMMVSVEMYRAYPGGADPARIAAQVVSGIGFLGAGTILREGMTVRGLTTAASLWVIAGIGLATGAGLVVHAATATALILSTLVLLSRFERTYLHSKRWQTLYLTIADRPGQLGRIGTVLGDHSVNIQTLTMRPISEPGRLQVQLKVVLPQGMNPEAVVDLLARIDGVYQVEWIDMR